MVVVFCPGVFVDRLFAVPELSTLPAMVCGLLGRSHDFCSAADLFQHGAKIDDPVVDFDGNAFDTAGIIPGVCKMGKNLQRVGYVTATALKDSIAARKGDQLRGHEFHFSMITKDEDYPDAYELQGTRQSTPHLEGYSKDNVLASYLHISFEGNPKAADHFINSCLSYKKTHL